MKKLISLMIWIDLQIARIKWIFTQEKLFSQTERQFVNGELGTISTGMFTLWVIEKQKLFPNYKIPEQK